MSKASSTMTIAISAKMPFRSGVRYEHLVSDYYENGVRIDEQSRTYDNVFPSFSLAMPVGKAELSLSYTSKSKYKGTGAGQEQRSRM